MFSHQATGSGHWVRAGQLPGDVEAGAERKARGTLVTFQDVGFSLPGRKRGDPRAQILQDVSGYFAPGTVTALMGPSGAGKTTLLDIVTGRKNQGQITGSLLWDGKKATRDFIKHHTAYVEQFDTLLGVLSVRDMILYQAQLKCDRRESLTSMKQRVEEIIVKLGLSACADVVIGDALNRGISGGQAKRTNIGIALVTEPWALFLDEPTSGLDSATSLDVVTIMRQLADEGRTVMSTIHSPTSEAFRLFDNLLLLTKGRTTYFGTLNGKAGAAAYFGTLGIPYDPATNLADFLIAQTGNTKASVDFAGAWASSERATSSKADIAERLEVAANVSVPPEKPPLHHNFLTSLAVLLRFRTRANYRFPDYVVPRIMPSIYFGFIVCTLYAGAGRDAKDPLNVAARGNVAAALFMSTMLPSFVATTFMPSIVAERPLFYREHSDGCYSTFAYILFKLVEEGFLQIFASLAFCIMTYFNIQLQGDFGWHWLIYYFTSQTGIALAYICASVAPNMDAANTLLPIINVTSMFFAGVLMTFDSIPQGWKWYPWVTVMRYAWSAHMLNNFGTSEDCDDLRVLGTPGCPVQYWGLKKGSAGLDVGANLGALVGWWVLLILIAFVVMSKVRFVKR